MFDRTFITITSNSKLYPNQKTNNFRVKLPQPLRFDGDYLVALHSISYPYSWKKLGSKELAYIDIIFHPKKNPVANVRLIFEKHSFHDMKHLIEYLNGEINHLVDEFVNNRLNLDKIDKHKMDETLRLEDEAREKAAKQSSVNTNTGSSTIKPIIAQGASGQPPAGARRKRSHGESSSDDTEAEGVQVKRRRRDTQVDQKDDDTTIDPADDLASHIYDNVDMDTLQKQLEEKDRKIVELEGKLDIIKAEVAEVKEKHQNAEDSVALERNLKIQAENDKAEAERKAQKAADEKDLALQQKAIAEDKINALTNEKKQVAQELLDVQQRLQTSTNTSQTELQEVQNRLAATELNLATANQDLKNANSQIDLSNRNLDDANQTIGRLQSDIATYQLTIQDNERRLQQAFTQMGKIGTEVQTIQNEKEAALKEVARLRQQIDFLAQNATAFPPPEYDFGSDYAITYDALVYDVEPLPEDSSYNIAIPNTDQLHPRDPYLWTKYYRGSVDVHHEVKREIRYPDESKLGVKTTEEPHRAYKVILDDKRILPLRRLALKQGETHRVYEGAEWWDSYTSKEKYNVARLLNQVKLSFKLSSSGRIQSDFKTLWAESIILSPELAYIMGFGEKMRIFDPERDQSTHTPDIHAGLHGFVIYEMNGLMERTIFSDELESVLRYVTVRGSLGQVVEENYPNPTWVKVLAKQIDELYFQIRTLDGEEMPFDWGTIVMTLVFRRALGA